MEKSSRISQIQQPSSWFPFCWALAANAANYYLSIQFYWVPSGSHIRPMAWTVWVFSVAVLGIAAIPMVLMTMRQHQRRFWLWCTVVLVLTPLPLALAMRHHAAKVRGFMLAP
jgi:hypothetical protein